MRGASRTKEMGTRAAFSIAELLRAMQKRSWTLERSERRQRPLLDSSEHGCVIHIRRLSDVVFWAQDTGYCQSTLLSD